MPVGGREREVLEYRLAAERPARIDAELDVADEVVEADTLFPWRDIGIGHPHDRHMAERDRARVAGGPLAERRGRLARVQAADEDAFPDERGVLGRRAFVVVRERAAQSRRG